jgi:integral membrane protein (TIGR01906 family)
LIAAATALVLLGGSIVPFLNPVYVRFEQDRTGVLELTGYSGEELDRAAAVLLSDLLFWTGDFDVNRGDGAEVLSQAEIAHMRDVRGVFAGFFALVLAGVAVLIGAFRRSRPGTTARAATWRAVGGGARGLAIGIAVAGAFAVLAFEAAFEVFHRLFFAAGSYTFDPRTDKLVQLFPYGFWSETSTFVGVVGLTAAVITFLVARRRAGAHALLARA